MGADQSITNPMDMQFPDVSCRIVVVGPKSGDDCLMELIHLPKKSRILATGNTLDEIRKDTGQLFSEANVILNVTGNSETLGPIITEMPYLAWIHTISAGVDTVICPEIIDNTDILVTNGRGIYSNSLAEYVMTACSYFAKNIPRLIEQKNNMKWEKFQLTEMRGQTMGIVGYGSIGRSCARLAKAYGMNVVALKRRPELSYKDGLVDKMYGATGLPEVMRVADYLVLCVPLTKHTKRLINQQALVNCRKGQVLINISRGDVIDDDAVVAALKCGMLAGAALDVFSTEPLPEASRWWSMPNVLLSPHNADMVAGFRHRSVRAFCDNCVRLLNGDELECVVDVKAGY